MSFSNSVLKQNVVLQTYQHNFGPVSPLCIEFRIIHFKQTVLTHIYIYKVIFVPVYKNSRHRPFLGYFKWVDLLYIKVQPFDDPFTGNVVHIVSYHFGGPLVVAHNVSQHLVY